MTNRLQKLIQTIKIFTLIMLAMNISSINAQDTTGNIFGKGISIIALDSSFSMKFSARFQTLYEGTLNTESNHWNDKFLTRRARLKFDGFAYSPKLIYKIELSMSNRDIGGVLPETNNTANIILDAVLKYKFAKGWQIWFGQTKLPGNRERVNSSQKLQFVDRSLVNGAFNLDRDLGFQLHHEGSLGNAVIKQALSLSKGDGRNTTVNNIGGYDFTARLEFLPFGEFIKDGDYFGSDLEREKSPKLSIGVVYDYNDGAGRQRGQLGGFVSDTNGDQVTNDLSTVFIDAILKYNGWSMATEYAHKSAKDDLSFDRKYGTGNGFVFQTGYLFLNNFEVAGRYTIINPDDPAFSGLQEVTEYTLGFSKYFSGHSLKIQSDLSYSEIADNDNEFRFRFQVELSF